MPIIQGTPKKGSQRGSKSKIDIVGVRRWIQDVMTIARPDDSPVVILEIQHPMAKQGVTSMFHLGESYGMLEALPQVMGWGLVQVQPQRWKGEILAGTTKDKTAAIQWCLGRYPGLDLNVGVRKVINHDGMADAACIAQYGWQELTRQGQQDVQNSTPDAK